MVLEKMDKNFGKLRFLVIYILICCVLNETNGQNPLGEKPSDLSSQTKINLPPVDFPKDHLAQRNDTVLKKLLHNDSEVDDLTAITSNDLSSAVSQPPINLNEKKTTGNDDYYYEDKDTVNVQYDSDEVDKDEPEERFHNQNNNGHLKEVDKNEIETNLPEINLNAGHIAGIVASSVVVACVAIYIALIIWRKKLEIKYGIRHRLVANDYNDRNVYSDQNLDNNVPDLEL